MNFVGDVSAKPAAAAPVVDPDPIDDLDRWALFLDVDGTLLDIAPSPEAVVVPPHLPGLLEALSLLLGGALALVTGREIAAVDRFFAPLKLPVAGIHGAELRLPDGTVRGAAVHPDMPHIVEELHAFAAGQEGLLVESKSRAAAVHYRLNPALGEDVDNFVRALVGKAAPGLEIQPGKMVVEIRPEKIDKGRSISTFLEHDPFFGRRPLMIGDDWTDEPGFRVANAHGGRSIRVGTDKRPTEATENMATPEDVHRWLAAMLEVKS